MTGADTYRKLVTVERQLFQCADFAEMLRCRDLSKHDVLRVGGRWEERQSPGASPIVQRAWEWRLLELRTRVTLTPVQRSLQESLDGVHTYCARDLAHCTGTEGVFAQFSWRCLARPYNICP